MSSPSTERDAVFSRRIVAIGFVAMYCPLLVLVFLSTSFSAEDSVHADIDAAMKRPPSPMPALPVVHTVEWPDIVVKRDPFQPATPSK